MELRRIIAAPRASRGLELMGELGATAVVLPELEALRGVEQSRFHHRDVYGHTLEVLERTIALTAACAARVHPSRRDASASHRAEVAALLAEPLADELTRGDALRWGALLHDAAKPLTREVRPADGRVTFIGHDVRGAELARAVLERLRASERLRAHVAALVRHHLRLGFLVHEPQPLSAADRVRLPAHLLAGRGRRDAPVGRRSPGHARGPRAGVDRRAPARRAGAARGCAALARAGPAAAARAGRRAGRRSSRIPAGPRVGELLERARRGAVRGRAHHARAGARLRAPWSSPGSPAGALWRADSPASRASAPRPSTLLRR